MKFHENNEISTSELVRFGVVNRASCIFLVLSSLNFIFPPLITLRRTTDVVDRSISRAWIIRSEFDVRNPPYEGLKLQGRCFDTHQKETHRFFRDETFRWILRRNYLERVGNYLQLMPHNSAILCNINGDNRRGGIALSSRRFRCTLLCNVYDP